MTLIGFSTGAVALGDFERALGLLGETSMTAVELSALRLSELPTLVRALPRLDLQKFQYVSVHAPSRFSRDEEDGVVELLQSVPVGFPIVVHPDTIHDSQKWRQFGSQLSIENMDRRKYVGRTAEEMSHWFDLLPEARLCLDLAHVHQFDRTMTEAYRFLKKFKEKIRQLHVSELDSTGHHYPLSFGSIRAFREISSMISPDVAIILESLSPMSWANKDAQIAWIEQEVHRAFAALGRTHEEASSPDSPSQNPLLHQASTA